MCSVNGTHVNQRKYVLDILSDTWLLGAKVVDVPLPRGHKFVASQSNLLTEPVKYRRLVERLLYLNFMSHSVNLLEYLVSNIGILLCMCYVI